MVRERNGREKSIEKGIKKGRIEIKKKKNRNRGVLRRYIGREEERKRMMI